MDRGINLRCVYSSTFLPTAYTCCCINIFPGFSSKFLLVQIPFPDIFNYIKTVALQYAKNCIKIVPDIVFRPESGLFFQYKDIPYVFVSNFTSEHGGGTRVNEVKHNRKWFADQGYTIIDIPDEFPFEGGAEVKYVKHGDRDRKSVV